MEGSDQWVSHLHWSAKGELADKFSQERLFDTVSIVLIGKYTSLQDSYMSVVKALEHASMRCGQKLDLQVGSSPRPAIRF